MKTSAGKPAKVLSIEWARLVSSGKTCPRCGSTGKGLGKAVSTLRRSLSPLGIKVVLKKRGISLPKFKRAPLASNRILVNGRPLEGWLGGKTGRSRCCSVCGPSKCRTVKAGGKTYESIPAKMIVRAGLAAAARMRATRREL